MQAGVSVTAGSANNNDRALGVVELGDPWSGRAKVALLLVVVSLIVAGMFGLSWWNGRWQTKRISLLEVDGRTVIAGSHCEPESRLLVRESGREIRLTFQVRGDHMGDCYGTARATLDRPVGDRRLVDERTGSRPPLGKH